MTAEQTPLNSIASASIHRLVQLFATQPAMFILKGVVTKTTTNMSELLAKNTSAHMVEHDFFSTRQQNIFFTNSFIPQ